MAKKSGQRTEPETIAIERVLDALDGETDRGCAMVAAEHLSDALAKLLGAEFTWNRIKRSEIKRLLKGFNAPLSSFAMRIAFCRAFGLIPHEMARLLDALREIRNHFAHTKVSVSFDDPEILPWVRHLREMSTKGNDARDDSLQSRQLFMSVFSAVTIEINNRTIAIHERLIAVYEHLARKAAIREKLREQQKDTPQASQPHTDLPTDQ